MPMAPFGSGGTGPLLGVAAFFFETESRAILRVLRKLVEPFSRKTDKEKRKSYGRCGQQEMSPGDCKGFAI
jgi:hypothetical protein